MKILVECIWESDNQPLDGDTVYEKDKYWLMHFGTEFKLIEVGDGQVAAVNYTVAICSHCETGAIETFLPKQIRIIATKW